MYLRGPELESSEEGDFISSRVTGPDSSFGMLSRCPAEGLEGIPAPEIINGPVGEGDACGLGDHPSQSLPKSQADKWTSSTLALLQAGPLLMLTRAEHSYPLQPPAQCSESTVELPAPGWGPQTTSRQVPQLCVDQDLWRRVTETQLTWGSSGRTQ